MAKKQATQAAAEYNWAEHEGATGFEETKSKDLGVPFLAILQKGNPEVDKTHPNHGEKKIDGAEAGCIINNLSRAIVYKPEEEKLAVVPCSHQTVFVEWTPRESGGGIVQVHKTPAILNECGRNEKNQPVLKNGNLVVETSYFYVQAYLGGNWVPAVIGLTSTQLKKSRFWLNLMMALRAPGSETPVPMFAKRYMLSTKVETSTKGSWFGWEIESGDWNTDGEFIASCRTIAQEIASGASPLPLIGGGETEDAEKF